MSGLTTMKQAVNSTDLMTRADCSGGSRNWSYGMIPPSPLRSCPFVACPSLFFPAAKRSPYMYIQVDGLAECCKLPLWAWTDSGRSWSQKITFGCKNLRNMAQYNIYKQYPICRCCFTLFLPHYSIPRVEIMAAFFTNKNCYMPTGDASPTLPGSATDWLWLTRGTVMAACYCSWQYVSSSIFAVILLMSEK